MTRKTFQRPVRVMICPEPVVPTRLPIISGIDSRPASVGEKPRATWKYWPRKTGAPNIAMPTPMLATIASAVVRVRITRSGSSGSETLVSTMTSSTASTAAPPSISALSQPNHGKLVPANDTQIIGSDAAPAISRAPSTSGRVRRRTVSRCR